MFNKRVINPLEELKTLIGQPQLLKEISLNNSMLPSELIPILKDVIVRDEIIRQKNIESMRVDRENLKSEMRNKFVHNIKFPLTLIRDFILEKKSVEENQETYLIALKDLEILSSQLSSDSVNISREIDIIEFVQKTIKSKKLEFKEASVNVEIKLNTKEKNLKVKFDPVELRCALSNLINNSKESSIIKGKCLIEISIFSQSNNAVIEITDNGCGISKKLQDKLFIKGATFNKPGGTGLGLYHAKKSIESEGGHIELNSVEHEGTTVKIDLPLLKNKYLSHGKKPFKNVMVEDFKLNQVIWLQEGYYKI